MSVLDKFNRTFAEFVDDLIGVFPNDAEFRMVKIAIMGMTMAAPNMLHESFSKRVVVPFGDKILARDEGFFLDADYTEHVTDVDGVESPEEAARLVDKVKHMYRKMGPDDQAVVWKYMRVLVLLAKKIGV